MDETFAIQIELENNGILILDISPQDGVNSIEYFYDIYIQFGKKRKWVSCGYFRTLDSLLNILDKYKETVL